MHLLLLLPLLLALSSSQDSDPLQVPLLTFEEFKEKFQKVYGDSEPHRRNIFQNNVRMLLSNPCSTCGVTPLFDLTDEEFAAMKGLIPSLQSSPLEPPHSNKLGLPNQLNWQNNNVVTSVKNQGACGTCWSFATIAMCESNLILKGQASEQVDLSEQYLLDCTPKSSCSGGYLNLAAETAVGGVPTETAWPYLQAKSGQDCKRVNNKIVAGTSYSFYTNVSDYEIKQMLVNGPVAVAVSSSSWKYYTGGVARCSKDEKVDHAVLLVGYNGDGWILKNQWGRFWGENGFIRVAYGQNDCRIGSEVTTLSEGAQRVWLLAVAIVIVMLHF